mgnify:CR=1 FL=1
MAPLVRDPPGGSMTKADLVEQVSKGVELTKKDVGVVVDQLLGGLVAVLDEALDLGVDRLGGLGQRDPLRDQTSNRRYQRAIRVPGARRGAP